MAEQLEHHTHPGSHDRLVGPGVSVDSTVRYLLVTPEIIQSIRSGHAHPAYPVQHDEVGLLDTGVRTHYTTQPSEALSPTGDKFTSHLEHHQGQGALGLDKTSDTLGQAPQSAPQDDLDFNDGEPDHTVNPITRTRYFFREYFGEFIGTMILIIFGNGVNCQVVLSNFKQGEYLSISFGWGIGVMFGVYIAGGISGAHINPAVTISLAIFRKFPWRKVPGYALAQILGALVGSCLIQGNYHNLLNQFEGGYNLRTYGLDTSTAALFFTDTKPYMSNIGAFFSEVLATAVLLSCILAIGDKNNNPAPPGMNGMILMFLIVGIGAALGTETAYCLNPARDLGPRIACAMFGYPSKIWTYRHCYWIYTAILAPIVGGVLGSFLYDLTLYQGEDSPLNQPWGRKKKALQHDHHHQHHAGNGTKEIATV